MREEGIYHAAHTSDHDEQVIIEPPAFGKTEGCDSMLLAGHQMMKALSILSLMAGLILAGCKKEEASPPKSSTSSGGNPITAPVDYLDAAARAKQKAATTVSSAGLDKAIQMFAANEGRFPKDLNELVRPDYLGAIPPPPAGMQYSYNPTNGVVKIVPK